MNRTSILAALMLAGCATVSPQPAGPTVAFGQTATVGGARVTPIQVVEDSRCPSRVQCVWAGRLILLALVEYRGGSEEYRGNLTLGEPLSLGAERVTLSAAEPGPLAGGGTDPRAYRFTFAYSREN
ncbi:MAG TPA: hypothetical protein VFK50_04600 [Sphingomicrobium sp.]|nr:hypothetical protein [Sphingomicrobium sp.]